MSQPPNATQLVFTSMQPGQPIGTSDWVTVTQEMITKFGEATLDRDPMHVDPAWAAAGPFGTTISFGFLTMSLLTHMLHRTLGSDSSSYDPRLGYYLNYGFDRMRLVTPVPVGSRIRAQFVLASLRPDSQQRSIARFDVKLEIEGHDRPALIAEWLTVWVPPEPGQGN
jgi:acyl dehydratase